MRFDKVGKNSSPLFNKVASCSESLHKDTKITKNFVHMFDGE